MTDTTGRMEVVVRRAEPDDAAALQDALSQPRAQAGTMQVPYPSVGEWRARLDDLSPDHRVLVACQDHVGGRVLGSLSLRVLDLPRRRHVASLGMAVHDDWTGRGVGTALMEAAVDLSDNWLQVLRVELEVYRDNGPARALYDRFGFLVEGARRGSVFRDGEYVDTLVMARLHPRLAAQLAPAPT